MDIDRRIRLWLWQFKIFVQRFARNVGKRRQNRHTMPCVAPGLENVCVRAEAAKNGGFVGQRGCQIVGGSVKAVDSVL